jgi:hypothetical protein
MSGMRKISPMAEMHWWLCNEPEQLLYRVTKETAMHYLGMGQERRDVSIADR